MGFSNANLRDNRSSTPNLQNTELLKKTPTPIIALHLNPSMCKKKEVTPKEGKIDLWEERLTDTNMLDADSSKENQTDRVGTPEDILSDYVGSDNLSPNQATNEFQTPSILSKTTSNLIADLNKTPKLTSRYTVEKPAFDPLTTQLFTLTGKRDDDYEYGDVCDSKR